MTWITLTNVILNKRCKLKKGKEIQRKIGRKETRKEEKRKICTV